LAVGDSQNPKNSRVKNGARSRACAEEKPLIRSG